jgi:catechol 2,3-dioxygenase-like lactoylglutathione lyase family enzyme
MGEVPARLLKDTDHGTVSRRKLLQTLGIAAAGMPLAAAFRTSAFAQGGCRDGYGQGRCPLSKEAATAAIQPIFAPTGWKTTALDHIRIQVADYKKEAAFYMALMGWKLRSDDGKQAIMDLEDWGSVIFKQAPPGAMEAAAPAEAGAAGAGGRGGGGGRGGAGGRGAGGPVRAIVQGFAFVIDPWNAKTVEAELRKRGLTPVAENDDKGFESFHVKDPDGWDLQICNGNGLAKARKTPATAKLSEPAPFAPTGWKTVWLDHFSFGANNYKQSASFYMNLIGWKETYDEGTQHELMIGDVGDIIIRGGNPNDPNFGRGGAGGGRGGRIDHISFGISPWDVDGVKAELEKRGLRASIDTSSAHLGPDGKYVSDDIHQAAFQSYHTQTPNGYNLQISWVTRDKRLALPMAVKPKPTGSK